MVDYSSLLDLIPAISITIGVIYYIATLRNQNTSRQIQIIRGVMSHETTDWNWLDMTWDDYDDFKARYRKTDSEDFRNMMRWFNNFEELGVYVREGMLNVRLICLLSGGTYIQSWEKFKPVFYEWRVVESSPRFFVEAEYIYNKMKDYMDKHKEQFTP